MYYISWRCDGHHVEIICKDGQSVFIIADMLEALKIYYKVTDMCHLITANDLGGIDLAYKFWVNGK